MRYEALAQPFAGAKPRDDFWIALLTNRAELAGELHLFEDAWSLRDRVADFLAGQPPSPETARRYIDFLQRALPDQMQARGPAFEAFRTHFVHGARVGLTADDRAWCQWQIARLQPAMASESTTSPRLALRERAALWSAALAAAAGTRWLSFVRAEEFIWRTSSRWSPEAAPDTPADIPALLTELRAIRETLPPTPGPNANSIRAELHAIENSLEDPSLIVHLGSLVAPGDPVAIAFGASGLASLAFTLEQLPPEEWIALELPNTSVPPDSRNVHRSARARQVREWSIPLPDSAQLAWHSQIVEAAPSLKPGTYLLTVTGHPRAPAKRVTWQGRFIVSSLRGLAQFSSAT
ncbi:MAG TPA: hypothetical protein VEA63_13455, partial [Opitutus sp.]|nr:hypothetical protein [Opitutus sp.]